MFWSLLTLFAIAIMVFTMRPAGGVHPSRASRASAQRPNAGRRPLTGPARGRSDDKISYRLMEERLPSRGERLWRSIARVFLRSPRVERRPTGTGGETIRGEVNRGEADGPQRHQSAELQSFLEARRSNPSKRGSGETKRGPDDTLH